MAQAGFTYDALGRRNLEWYPGIYYSGNPLNVFTYFSPQGQAIEDHWGTSPSVSATYQYVWSLAYVNAMVERDDLTGNGPSRLYALQDANFNVTGIVDAGTGAVVDRYQYDPYGAIAVLNATTWAATGGGTSFSWLYLFQGGRFDYGTGSWYKFGNRDYIPTEGRWAQRDPIAFAGGGADFYLFVGDSPIGGTDPSGLAGERYYGQSIAEGAWWTWEVGSAGTLGALQGAANTANGVQDGFVGMANLPALAYNNTAGRLGGGSFGYFNSPDWSRSLIAYESDSTHDISKFLGGTGATILISSPSAVRSVVGKAAVALGRAGAPAALAGGRASGCLSQGGEFLDDALRTVEQGAPSRVPPSELTPTHRLKIKYGKAKKEFDALKSDIQSNGIQEPIKYVEVGGSKYIVDGHHRLRAANELGLKNVPVEKVELPYGGYKTPNDLYNYFNNPF